jgi:chitin disaccharide deacetylase
MLARAPNTSKHTMKPGLIVNADDLGLDAATTRGIVSAYRRGIVSSASLMVTTPGAEDAANTARALELPVGLHVSLTQGRAVAKPDPYRLVDECGRFNLPPQRLIRASRKDSTLIKQIRTEIRAQLSRALDLGLALTHVDSHQHVHMNPVLFEALEEEASAFGIRRIRFSREPLRVLFLSRAYSQILKRNNLPKWLIARACSSRIKPRLETPELFFGILNSGALLKPVLLNILATIPSHKSVEICVHPGLPEPSSSASGSPFEAFSRSAFRRLEHDALVDPEVIALVQKRGLLLLSFDGSPKHWSKTRSAPQQHDS